jgi:DNA-binding transcriptional MerR regulator
LEKPTTSSNLKFKRNFLRENRMNGLTIGALATRSGASTATIRYYEEIGLLQRADRKAGGHRTYGAGDERRLTFIRRCRDFGFPIEQVRTLVSLFENPDRSCMEARDLAKEHLSDVRRKLSELRGLEKNLAAFVKDCDAQCAGGPGSECIILEDLSAPRAASKCCGPSQ